MVYERRRSTMININDIAYCELNLTYPKKLFCDEVDQYIIPTSPLVRSVPDNCMKDTVKLNQSWNMAPDNVYLKEDSNLSWYANSLLYCDTDNEEFRKLGDIGSIVVRNNLMNKAKWYWKYEFEHLELTKFIKNLPLTDIFHARTLCMPPGRMSGIHRDSKRSDVTKTSLSSQGYITITLNLSDGGQPLFFSLLTDENTPIKTSADAFIFRDFNYHGVPSVTTWRRQLRITGKPTTEFFDLLKIDTLLCD